MGKFDASHKKVNRAESKFSQLKSAINRHLNEHIEVVVKRDGDDLEVRAKIKRPIPDDIGFEIVEAVGHLRSSLDKMMADIVDANGHGTSDAKFPFGGLSNSELPEPFPSKRHEKIEKKLTTEQWELVLAQKPYPGGNNTLWGVNAIANADKHGKGLVDIRPRVNSLFGPSNFTTQHGREAEIHFGEIISGNAIGDHLLVRTKYIKGNLHFKQAAEVVFSDVHPFAEENVLVVLNQSIRLVKHLLKIFAGTI